MAAKYFSITFDPAINVVTRNGVKSAVVIAETSADALAVLKSLYGDDADWTNATATEFSAGTDLAGWTLHLEVINPAAHPSTNTLFSLNVVGVTSDTFDLIGAAAVTALNALSEIAHAAYSSNVLTVAGTADGIGDYRLIAAFYPPGEALVAVPGFLGTVVDEGASGDALTVAFAADAYSIPNITARYKAAQQ